MSKYTLEEGMFLYPTPTGSYYAVASGKKDKARGFLKRLLQQAKTPELNVGTLLGLMDVDSEDKALKLLYRCQKAGWVQGVKEVIKAPEGTLEEILPPLLDSISETGKVLLADDMGFYLACSGFPHEAAEELSALSAEIATVHERREGLLRENLGVGSSAWSVVDAFGNSQVGFWPIFIGNSQFVITVSGTPHFNQFEFVMLIWALSIRYEHI
jgi:hypothetical protein